MYKLSQFLYSAKLGDGCFYRRKEHHTCLFQFTSYNKEYIDFMHKEFDKLGYFPQSVKKIHSGFKEGSEGYYFHTRVHEDFNYVKSLSVKETISMLDKNGLIFYYLDDGSYHKNRHFGHIYCNTFTVDEVNCLIDKIYDTFNNNYRNNYIEVNNNFIKVKRTAFDFRVSIRFKAMIMICKWLVKINKKKPKLSR